MQSDKELVEACCRGDRAAANTLVLRYQAPVYTLALRMLGDATEAEDAAQTVFLNALRGLASFRGQSSLKTWLYRIAVHECMARNQLRARYAGPKQGNGSEENAVEQIPDPARLFTEDLAAGEQDRDLHRAVGALPETYRMAVILRYFDDLSYEETAAALGVSVDTVKVRLFRAKALLRASLSGQEEASS